MAGKAPGRFLPDPCDPFWTICSGCREDSAKKRSREELALLIEQTGETASWVVEGVFGKLIGEYLDDAETFHMAGHPVADL